MSVLNNELSFHHDVMIPHISTHRARPTVVCLPGSLPKSAMATLSVLVTLILNPDLCEHRSEIRRQLYFFRPGSGLVRHPQARTGTFSSGRECWGVFHDLKYAAPHPHKVRWVEGGSQPLSPFQVHFTARFIMWTPVRNLNSPTQGWMCLIGSTTGNSLLTFVRSGHSNNSSGDDNNNNRIIVVVGVVLHLGGKA
jgi:hypothetical protein